MPLTQITMLTTRRGVADQHAAVREYQAGETYAVYRDISDTTARYFMRSGWAYNSTQPADPWAPEELSTSAFKASKERVVQNPATLLATGVL